MEFFCNLGAVAAKEFLDKSFGAPRMTKVTHFVEQYTTTHTGNRAAISYAVSWTQSLFSMITSCFVVQHK